MSLQLIVGSSGAGKSYVLYESVIKESDNNKDTNYIIVVPEQFTMQTQKDLVSRHPRKGIMNIDILSFLRLAYRVFDEVGGNDRIVLEDIGKSMILRKIVEEKKDELIFMKSNIRKQGFIDELKSLLSEFFQYNISENKIEEIIKISKKKPTLQGKMQDILTVYKGFREFLQKEYITEEEILDLLCEVIDKSKILQNTIICFDGFTGFTPSQCKLLGKLMVICKKVFVTVTIDLREDMNKIGEEHKLFYLSHKTIEKLNSIAIDNDVPIDEIYKVGKEFNYRFKESKALEALEKNLFRYKITEYKEEQEDINIFVSKNKEKEIEVVINEILKLAREENYRYRDIAIVTGDIEEYGEMTLRKLSEANIPCFLDHKKNIIANPAVQLINSVIEIAATNFSYESVFHFLRCGLVDIELEDVDKLENYVIACGIRGKRSWSLEWNRTYRTKEKISLEYFNDLRKKVINMLKIVVDVLKKKDSTVFDNTKAIYEFLVELKIEEKLGKLEKKFEEKKDMLLAKEYKQMYRVIMELFEQLVDLIAEEKLTLKEYKDVLETGFSDTKVGLIPPGVDQIVIGDLERTRLNDIKALFVVGVNDNIIPKSNTKGGFLSELEREEIVNSNIELAPTKRQSSYIEQFYLYINLTKPKNKLYLTYSKVGSDARSLRASYLIGKMLKLFEKLKVVDKDIDFNFDDKNDKNDKNNKIGIKDILGYDNGFRYLKEGLREYPYNEMPDEWKEIFNYYLSKDEYKEELIKMIEGVFYKRENKGISGAVAKALYGNTLNGSVTRMEKYAACAFAHFVRYGLRLEERAEFKLAVPDLGNIFHSILELYSRKLKENSLDWHNISDEDREKFSEISVKEVTSDYGNSVLLDSKRNEYMIERIKRIIKKTIWAVGEQIKRGKLEPNKYEVKFSYLDDIDALHLKFSDKDSMYLQGRIDRIDLYEEENKIYLKVVDYKSGRAAFDVVSLYYGLQLQLVIYLKAAMELEKKNNKNKEIVPAGIFYYHIDDPVVEKKEDYKEAQKEILKELKVKGIVNSDIQIEGLLDESLVRESVKGIKSDVIPVEITKSGALSKNSTVADTKDFLVMTDFATKKMEELGRGFLNGDTAVNPYKLANETACDYCEYNSICGFDLNKRNEKYNNLSELDKKEVLEKMLEENKEGNK